MKSVAFIALALFLVAACDDTSADDAEPAKPQRQGNVAPSGVDPDRARPNPPDGHRPLLDENPKTKDHQAGQ